MKRGALLVCVLLVSLLALGCAQGGATVTPTPTAGPSPTPTAVASVSPTPTVAAQLCNILEPPSTKAANASGYGVPLQSCIDCSNLSCGDCADYDLDYVLERTKDWILPGENISECCGGGFDAECGAQGGVVQLNDMHPLWSFWKTCYPKAPDAGQPCSSSDQCVSGWCSFEAFKGGGNASGCVITSKVPITSHFCLECLSGAQTEGYDEEQCDGVCNAPGDYYVANYSCPTNLPGTCTETGAGARNPGGISWNFTVQGCTLVVVKDAGLIM